MKLQHLQIGDSFEYEGVIYVKTGPLTASSEPGGQRIIPRYAMLRPLNTPADEAKCAGSSGVDTAKVRMAFTTLFETCNRLVDDEGRQELAKARTRFLKALD